MGKKKRLPAAAGYDRGYNQGYDQGFDQGYGVGLQQGRSLFLQPFEGVSIIIPTYNQQELLRQCLISMAEHTPERHEVIVVDNASTDETCRLADEFPQVRFLQMERNLGFAGGINQGLRAARGSHLLLLNNDTVLTPRWLSQLLICCENAPGAGLVGPVTNYISGEQQISTDYGKDLEAMQRFAKGFNRTDPSLWKDTSRLTGFCVMMKRSVYERIGFWDEGFSIGNCEDDDYGLRTKLLGLRLIIARDTFIHHVGSASMKELGERFDPIYQGNLAYYSSKWGSSDELLYSLQAGGSFPQRAVDGYPTMVLVQGIGQHRYWVEDGHRHPVEAGEDLPAVRLSHVDLRQWPLGPVLHRDQVLARQHELRLQAARGVLAEGVILPGTDGKWYQQHQNRLRPFHGEEALKAWIGDTGAAAASAEGEGAAAIEAGGYERGLPILAPPILKVPNL